MAGRLYLVSVPIGNWDDITIRALNTLKEVDEIICEELSEGKRLIHHYGINKPLLQLNEHDPGDQVQAAVTRLKGGENLALVSDCGTPVFADPGQQLIHHAHELGIRVIPIPGASSLMAALVSTGFPFEQFYYAGFLSAKKENRRLGLKKLSKRTETIILMDAPYRLLQMLEDLKIVFKMRPICVGFDLTLPTEVIRIGTAEELLNYFKTQHRKGEFVIVISPVI